MKPPAPIPATLSVLSDRDIRALADHMRRARIRVLEVTQPGQRIRLRMRAVEAEAAPADEAVVLRSTAVGLFRRRHPDGVFAAVEIGSTVEASRILAFLQVGLLLQPLMAGRRGTLTRVLVADDAHVGYGTPLFELHERPR